MLKQNNLEKLDDFFVELSRRKNKGVYFLRINGINESIHNFIRKYYEAARTGGVIIEGKIPNPDNKNLEYYNEIMGYDFKMDSSFICSSLKKWLPRMNDVQRENVSAAIYNTLDNLRKAGKNEGMLKNAYIKFMCWLYYKFERIVNHLGEEKVPKILYDGDIGNYELLLMKVLSLAGCDIVFLQYKGDSGYLKLDPNSVESMELKMPGMKSFPDGYGFKQIRNEIQQEFENERLYGEKPKINNCTNAWMSGIILDDVRKYPGSRGEEIGFFYNCFCRITGVEDKVTYQNELFQLQLEIKNSKRSLVILNNLDVPTTDEISKINRRNYQNSSQMISEMVANLNYISNADLKSIVRKNLIDFIINENKNNNNNLSRTTNKTVYILCWLRRYYNKLFANWKQTDIPCLFYMGGCKNENEANFFRFLGRLPVDVIIFNPNIMQKCCLVDELLYDVEYDNSLTVSKFPEDNIGLSVGTTAYHAERELDTLMYKDSGLYRTQQYAKANIICLRTMYEEISILWNQELKYRQGFSTMDEIVNIPVIFSKISGVKNGNVDAYWKDIKKLLTEDTTLITSVPHIIGTSQNSIKQYCTEFYKNGRFQREAIKSHKAYQYGFLREAMQEFLLDKLQLLIEQRIIKGTFENGTEYTILAVALNLDKEILRTLQKFDFTKKNPKIVYVITGEQILSLEDTIYVTYLNLLGFDIVFYVPTGYQSIEKYLNQKIIEEHQIGEFIYDLRVPNFDMVVIDNKQTWRNKIFKRGN